MFWCPAKECYVDLYGDCKVGTTGMGCFDRNCEHGYAKDPDDPEYRDYMELIRKEEALQYEDELQYEEDEEN